MRATTAILIIMLCACRTETKLSDDKGIQDIFSPSEIVDLKKVLSDFDQLVLEVTNSSDIKTGYKALSETTLYIPGETNWTPIDKKMVAHSNKTILELENKSIFSELWKYDYFINLRSKDSIVEASPRTFDSKYSKFLDHCVSEEKQLDIYRERVQGAGDIPPTIFHGFPFVIKELKLEKECIRLFVAIHFITARNRQQYDDKIHGKDVVFPTFSRNKKANSVLDQLIEPVVVEE